MSDFEKTFDWVQFQEGRARFAGLTRGSDERGHYTFAVDINGTEHFGEIGHKFLSNENDFNVEVISFGYVDEIFAGSEPPWKAFTSDELDTVQILVVQLVKAGLSFESRPYILREDPDARFMGKVIFREGWATLKLGNDDTSSAQSAMADISP